MGQQTVEQSATWSEFQVAFERSEYRLEYIDGQIVTPGLPFLRHQLAIFALTTQILASTPSGWVVVPSGVAWRPQPEQEIGPDILVGPDTGEQEAYTGHPLLLVEVLSGNKSNDYIRKMGVYARYGVAHYWILDPVEGRLEMFELDADTGSYGLPARTLTAADGPANIDMTYGKLTIDLSAIDASRRL